MPSASTSFGIICNEGDSLWLILRSPQAEPMTRARAVLVIAAAAERVIAAAEGPAIAVAEGPATGVIAAQATGAELP